MAPRFSLRSWSHAQGFAGDRNAGCYLRAVATVVAATGLMAGCARKQPPGVHAASSVEAEASASAGLDATEVKMLEAAEPTAAPPATEHGAMVGVMGAQAQIYLGPAATRETRIGYLRRGAKVAADPTTVRGEGCAEGWYHLLPFGYVCAKNVTLDLNNVQVRLGVTPPKLDQVLPYPYAHNLSHGTPLYRAVPSRSEMGYYEPYLNIANAEPHHERSASATNDHKHRRRSKAKEQDDAGGATDTDESASPGGIAAFSAPMPVTPQGEAAGQDALREGAGGGPDAAAAEANKPWWAKSYEKGQHPEIKLADLTEGADGMMVRRMARGFYVAVDRTFSMNNRTWHKTTNGLIAPADRMAMIKGPTLSGQEIDEGHAANGVMFVLAKQAVKYELDETKNALKPIGSLERYDRAFTTGRKTTIGGRAFQETTDGYWIRSSDGTYTDPGPAPVDLGAGEKWIDVNLTRQTIVAFEGTRPVFATLLSSGRKGADKEHDHTTPKGTWRIREKHIAATMDGDGAAAGDMPYSIEDVPYIMYFFESYALHGAFWHDNFGRQQSHGCVNLAPLDAKRLFFWSDPPIPAGWHGMSSSASMPGTRVVVHD